MMIIILLDIENVDFWFFRKNLNICILFEK